MLWYFDFVRPIGGLQIERKNKSKRELQARATQALETLSRLGSVSDPVGLRLSIF